MFATIEICVFKSNYIELLLEMEEVQSFRDILHEIEVELLCLKSKNPNDYVSSDYPGEIVKVETRRWELEYSKGNVLKKKWQFTIESVCDFIKAFPYDSSSEVIYLYFTRELEDDMSDETCVLIERNGGYTFDRAIFVLKLIQELISAEL